GSDDRICIAGITRRVLAPNHIDLNQFLALVAEDVRDGSGPRPGIERVDANDQERRSLGRIRARFDICVFDGERFFNGSANLRFGHPEARITEPGHFILRLLLRLLWLLLRLLWLLLSLRSQTQQKKTGNECNSPPRASAAAHVLDSSTERC